MRDLSNLFALPYLVSISFTPSLSSSILFPFPPHHRLFFGPTSPSLAPDSLPLTDLTESSPDSLRGEPSPTKASAAAASSSSDLPTQLATLQAKLDASEAQSAKMSAVLRELTPLEGIGDDEGLRAHLLNLGSKVEVSRVSLSLPFCSL
jgi:hypothetical protein